MWCLVRHEFSRACVVRHFDVETLRESLANVKQQKRLSFDDARWESIYHRSIPFRTRFEVHQSANRVSRNSCHSLIWKGSLLSAGLNYFVTHSWNFLLESNDFKPPSITQHIEEEYTWEHILTIFLSFFFIFNTIFFTSLYQAWFFNDGVRIFFIPFLSCFEYSDFFSPKP